mmetsp:Transcript_18932/g.32581  ORF Transcript_18932/g.32581 Transcript_18932/m.32581 type:complete len:272 (+) Transcript_18932:920-1735(+)
MLSTSSGTTRLTNFSTSALNSSLSFCDLSPMLIPTLAEPIVSSSFCTDSPSNCAAASTIPSQSPLTTIRSSSFARVEDSLESVIVDPTLASEVFVDSASVPDKECSELLVSASSAAVAPTMAQSPASMAALRSSRDTLDWPGRSEWISRGLLTLRRALSADALDELCSLSLSTGTNEGLESLCVEFAVCVTMSAIPIVANNLSGLPGKSPSSVLSSKLEVFSELMPAELDQPDSLAALEESDFALPFVGEEGTPDMSGMLDDAGRDAASAA